MGFELHTSNQSSSDRYSVSSSFGPEFSSCDAGDGPEREQHLAVESNTSGISKRSVDRKQKLANMTSTELEIHNRHLADKKKNSRIASYSCMSPEEQQSFVDRKRRADRERSASIQAAAATGDSQAQSIIDRKNRRKRERSATIQAAAAAGSPEAQSSIAHQPTKVRELLERLYESTQGYSYDPVENNGTEYLNPISVEEKAKMIKDYNDNMDPLWTIYGCACCGIWVKLLKTEPPLKRTLNSLSILILSESQLEKYNSSNPTFRSLRGVTKCTNGSFYALYRNLLTLAVDKKDAPVDANTQALLCSDCFTKTGGKRPEIPKFSLRNNVDYGFLAYLSLPPLTFLEKLLLSSRVPFAHVIKLSGGHGQFGTKSHWVTMETPSYSVTTEEMNSLEGEILASTFSPSFPRFDLPISMMFTGPMDKWESINSTAEGRQNLISKYGKVLSLSSERLYIWARYLGRIDIKEDQFAQAKLDKYLDGLFDAASVHSADSLVNLIEEQAMLNVPGASAFENLPEDDFAVEHAFLSLEDRGLQEVTEISERLNRLQYAQTMLYGQNKTEPGDLQTAQEASPKSSEHRRRSDNYTPKLHKIRYKDDSLGNEYNQFPEIIGGTFPTLFPYGYPFAGKLEADQLKHMLHQCSNAFSSDPNFVMYCWNMLQRRNVSQGSSNVFKDDQETKDELIAAVAAGKEFEEDLAEAVLNPKGIKAQNIEKWLVPLLRCASKKVQFAGDRSSGAFAEMLALNRWFGNGAFFLTMAPVTWKYGIFYRQCQPHRSNAGDLNGRDIESLIPGSNGERKKLKLESSYADVMTFIRHTQSVFENVIKCPMPPNLSNKVTDTLKPFRQRVRGLCGSAMGLFNAVETSTDGNLHTHTKIYQPIGHECIEAFSQYPVKNKAFGQFIDSIISSELSHARAWDINPPTPFQDPTLIQTDTEKVPRPTRTSLPIGPTEDDQIVDEFWMEFEGIAIHIQNHGNHNFSCWKNGSLLCRFKLPAHSWDQISGMIQIKLKRNKTDKTMKDTFCILPMIEPLSTTHRDSTQDAYNRWKYDKRCLILNTTKRSSDGATLRDPTNPGDTGLDIDSIEQPNNDAGRFNGLFSPCSATILVGCGGCHNNLQFVSKGGMGDASYIAKYISKGVGQLVRCLSIIKEAIDSKRTSTHVDADTNPYRKAIFILQQTLNNGAKRNEYSMTLMLGSCLEMAQFQSSHGFEHIHAAAARRHLITENSNTENVATQDDSDSDEQ